MKFRAYQGEMIDFRAALWIAFWLFILTTGEPDLLDAVTAWIGRL